MKFSAILLGIFVMLSTLVLVGQNLQKPHITGNSATDAATVRTTIIGSPTDSPAPSPPPSGGGGGGGSSSQSSVAPAVYGSATSSARGVTSDEVVKNYYESQPLKFAPITTSVATIKSPAERGRLTARTVTFAIGLALIVIAILIALILSHSHKPKKHRFKRNKV